MTNSPSPASRSSETPPSDLDALLEHIRPAVRAETPYLVDHPPNVEVKLNQNESPYDLPRDLKEELIAALAEVPFNRYPGEQPDRLRRRLAERTGHDSDGILVGNGSNELTYTFGLTMISKGTPVVLPRPMFALYEKVVRLCEGRLISVAPREDLSFDAEVLLEAVEAHRPALTVLTSPNNPTGLAMAFAEIEAIVEASPGFVVVDEAYVEFNDEPSAQTLLADHPNVIVLRTLSKAFGLAGLRLGFLMAHPAVITELMKSRLPFMVGRFAEQAGLVLLDRPDLLAERVEQMQGACRELTTTLQRMDGVEVVPSQTNFVLFKTDHGPKRLLRQLVDRGVLVRDMSGYPELRGYLRVNAGTPDENKAFLAALERALYAEHPA